jgi:hypothetical protein
MQEGKPGVVKPLTSRQDNFNEDTNEGVKFIDSREELINEFVKDYKQSNNTRHSVIVAARNNIVDSINSKIREQLFNTSEPFVEGDFIRTNSPHVVGKEVVIPNGFKGKVVAVEKKGIHPNLDLPLYKLTVEYDVTDKEGNTRKEHKDVTTIDPAYKKDLKSALNKLAQKAKTNQITWRTFYDLKGSIVDIGYNYAITAHKVQGSTYRNTYVVEEDILSFPGGKLQTNRMMYTAVSRPTSKLVIYSPTAQIGAPITQGTFSMSNLSDIDLGSYTEKDNGYDPDMYEAYSREMDNMLADSPISRDRLENYLLICKK